MGNGIYHDEWVTMVKLVGFFDARGTRANCDADEVVIKFPANKLREISFYLGNRRNV